MNILHWIAEHPVETGTVILGIPLATVLAWVTKKAAEFVFDWIFPKKMMLDDGDLSLVISYLISAGRSYGPIESSYTYSQRWVRPLGRNVKVWFLRYHWATRLFFYRGAPLVFFPKVKDENTEFCAYMRYLRGTVDWEELLVASAHRSNEADSTKTAGTYSLNIRTGNRETTASPMSAPHFIKDSDSADKMVGRGLTEKPIGWSVDDLKPDPDKNPLDDLSVSDSMRTIIRDFEFFIKHEEWYRERGCPWRRGYLLHGKPGTGKTSLVRAIAQAFKVPVNVFSLATMDDSDFMGNWRSSLDGSRLKIILLEDFDTIFHGRENVKEAGYLAFETVLNCIDGIEQASGVVLFVTTNHVEHIDAALGRPDENGKSTRPGRIDTIAEIGPLDHAGRMKLAMRILRNGAAAETASAAGDGDTGAQFENRCIAIATKELWDAATTVRC